MNMVDIKYNVMETISESSLSELGNLESFDESSIINNIIDIFNECEELDFDITYTEEMVPVFEHNTSLGKQYLVEYDNIFKLMKHYEKEQGYCNEEMAIKKLAEFGNVSSEDIILVIESDDTYKRMIFNLNERIKREKDPVAKSRLRLSLQNIKDKLIRLKDNKNIKLIKKKNLSK